MLHVIGTDGVLSRYCCRGKEDVRKEMGNIAVENPCKLW